ncbi:hypothetical protein [Novosphingobium sp.]|uniref:hypothetical protein n=1 Tax=Novosphingobium sp. TaxID=1874826 RepID=UPI003D0F4A2A
MTSPKDIAIRSVFVTQALGTMGVDPAWDAGLTAYLTCHARMVAQEEFGKSWYLNQNMNQIGLVKFGAAYLKERHDDSELNAARASYEAEQERINEAYYEPLWDASRKLALIPAPTIAAAIFKVMLIDLEELGNDSAMTVDCAEVVERDFARLMATPEKSRSVPGRRAAA